MKKWPEVLCCKMPCKMLSKEIVLLSLRTKIKLFHFTFYNPDKSSKCGKMLREGVIRKSSFNSRIDKYKKVLEIPEKK